MNVISQLAATGDDPPGVVERGRLFECRAMNPQLERAPWIAAQVVGYERCPLFSEPRLLHLRSCPESLSRAQGLERNQLTPATKRTTSLERLVALEFSSVPHT